MRGFFEGIRADVERIATLEETVEQARGAAGPHAQGLGTSGAGGGDPLAGVDRLIDTDAEAELMRARRAVAGRIRRATAILYGRDGRGGLARSRGSTDADILCCHYLQGYGWAAIARLLDVGVGGDWCRMRAMRAMDWLDRQDVDSLAEG